MKGKPDQQFDVKLTRNGPLIQNHSHVFSMISGNMLPIKIQNGYFSLKWTGFDDVSKTNNHIGRTDAEINSGYSVFENSYRAIYSKSIFEAVDILKQLTGSHFSASLADADGNIGYIATGSFVKRKQKKFGNTISRGWTDENDWVGLVQPSDKPFIINPEKGFIVHANGPITTNNVEVPVAVFVPGSARAMRITTLLQILISKKSGMIEYSDMIDILKDTKDLYAEKKKDPMIKVLRKHFIKEQHHSTLEVNQIMNLLHLWDSSFDKDLEEPTYFTLWEYFIMKNILTNQLPDNDIKMKILAAPSSNSFFSKFYENLEKDLAYKSEYWTQYNGVKISNWAELITRALENTIEYLRPYKNNNEAKWGSFHPSVYPHTPLSKTMLKPFFEKSTPASGSYNTINMCLFKYWNFVEAKFECKLSANLKMIAEFGVEINSTIPGNKITTNEVHYSIEQLILNINIVIITRNFRNKTPFKNLTNV